MKSQVANEYLFVFF